MGVMNSTDRFKKQREEMVRTQIARRGVDDARVLDAMRRIPRHAFVPEKLWPEAYLDHPLPIGQGQTISQPYMVGLMSSLLALKGGEKVLEIGTGSGYQAAILSMLAAEVYSVERIPELAEQAALRLSALDIHNVHLHVGDGSLGWPAAAPYDGVLVTAGAPEFPPDLPDQLEEGGRLVIPVGPRSHQVLQAWTKRKGEMLKEEILPVVFVPLVGEQGWQDAD
ncbi:MAG: protein-L-isoaspartate(D-aspartate) O-methyltransferase [Chloroflexota bacterium]|nr:protein-L-isoaspartate(D-aspartate) O-methyltransferase [Chloroflexota bacterium]